MSEVSIIEILDESLFEFVPEEDLNKIKNRLLRDQRALNRKLGLNTKVKNSKKMELSKVLGIVKKFDNTKRTSTLKDFVSSGELAFKLIKQTDEANLLLYVKLQRISGVVAQGLELTKCETWAELKTHLESCYEEKHDEAYVQAQFCGLKQLDNEKVADYGERTVLILSNLIHGYQRLMSKNPEDFPAHERLLRSQALFNFTRGLRREIAVEVRRINPKNLNEAIGAAKDEEILSPISRPMCQFCKKSNHASADSFKNNKNKTIVCTICQKKGYVAKDCYKGRKEKPSEEIKSKGAVPKDLSKTICHKCGLSGHYADKCQNAVKNSREPGPSGAPAAALQGRLG